MRSGQFAVSDTEETFLDLLDEEHVALETLPPRRAFELMIEFFSQWTASDVDIEDEGDGLLFQWGTYDWSTSGSSHFELNLTRQLNVREDEDDLEDEDLEGEQDDTEGLYQLSLTFTFEPSAATESLESGSFWFFAPASDSNPEEEVLSSPVLEAVEGLAVKNVELDFSPV